MIELIIENGPINLSTKFNAFNMDGEMNCGNDPQYSKQDYNLNNTPQLYKGNITEWYEVIPIAI